MRLTWIELLIKGIPEGFLDILAMFILTRTKFDKKKYVLISLLFIVLTYFIRMLPITFGVNSMISILLYTIIFVQLCNVEFQKAIKAAFIVLLVVFFGEGINMFLLIAIFGSAKTQEFFNVPLTKALCGFPSTLFLGIFILVSYFVMKKLNMNKKDVNGEISEKNNGQAVQ